MTVLVRAYFVAELPADAADDASALPSVGAVPLYLFFCCADTMERMLWIPMRLTRSAQAWLIFCFMVAKIQGRKSLTACWNRRRLWLDADATYVSVIGQLCSINVMLPASKFQLPAWFFDSTLCFVLVRCECRLVYTGVRTSRCTDVRANLKPQTSKP